MIHTLARSWCLAAATGLAVTSAAPLAAQPPVSPVAQVMRDWEQQRQRWAGVKYVLKGERIHPKGMFSTDLSGKPTVVSVPSEDTSTPVSRVAIFDFSGNRFRLEIDEQEMSRKGAYPVRRTFAFNGREYQGLNPAERNPLIQDKDRPPDLAIITGDADSRTFEFEHWPMFEALGILQSVDEIGPRSAAAQLAPKVEPGFFRVHGDGVHKGRRCLVLRTHARGSGSGRYEEYWVDPARGSQIVRHLLFLNRGPPHKEWVIDYKGGPGAWVPVGWTFTNRTPTGTLTRIDKITVAEFTGNPATTPSEFDIAPEPGMLVSRAEMKPRDASAPKTMAKVEDQRFFQINDSGESVEVERNTGEPVNRLRKRAWQIAVVAGAGLVTWGLWRFLRNRRVR